MRAALSRNGPEDYNTGRPHSALGYQTPVAFAANLTATGHHAALSGGIVRQT